MDLTYINPKEKEDKPQKVIIVEDTKKKEVKKILWAKTNIKVSYIFIMKSYIWYSSHFHFIYKFIM